MLNVALTGNIAAGKSTVVELFRGWGATIIDADELARQAQAPGGEVLAAIAQRFGSDVLAPDGALDRAALRSKVMGDQAALDALNAIVHPAVRRRRDDLAREARERGDVLVVNDIPLLFEILDRKSTRLNSSHGYISYAVFCLKKKKEDWQPSSRAASKRSTQRCESRKYVT